MSATSRGLDELFWATTDTLLAAFGLGVVLFPAVLTGNSVLGTPLDESAVYLIVGVIAVGGSYPFVAGEWSLGSLGEYIFAFTAAVLGFGLTGAIVLIAAGVELSGSHSVPRAAVFAVSYVVASLVVSRRESIL